MINIEKHKRARSFSSELDKRGDQLVKDIIRIYIDENNSKVYTAETLGISVRFVDFILNRYNIRKDKSKILEQKRKTCLEKYGTENPMQSEVVKQKSKDTCKRRYGTEYATQSEIVKAKTARTNLERYGETTNLKTEETKAKIRKTNLERYGVEVPTQSQEIRDKAKKTNLERYGTEYTFQSDTIKDKIKNTNLERYGVEYATQSDEIKNKIKKTSLEKYGTENPMQSDIVKEKTKKTNLEKYGVEYVTQSDIMKSKTKDALRRKYGDSITHRSRINLDKNILNVLDNKELFKEFLYRYEYEDRTFFNLSNDLGVSRTTIGRYCEIYGFSDIINRVSNSSHYEEDISNIIDIKFVSNSRYIIPPYEIDLYSKEYEIGIEFNGDYWHNLDLKPANYHQMKSMLAKEKGIFIYHIFEHEWNDPRKHDIIVSQLLNLFNKNSAKIYARKCIVREVTASDSRKFLNENHIQGYRNATYRYGLYYNDELVSIMTFSNDKFILKNQITEHTYELVRFCSKLGYSVVGGASKLFKYFVNKVNPDKIISYCDIAKGRGTTYEKLGFKLDKITTPNYHWVKYDGSDIKTRYQCQPRFIREGPDDKRTESYIMKDKGYMQVFDCGNYKFIWNK